MKTRRRTSISCATLTSAGLAFTALLSAGENSWTSNGPFDPGSQIAVDPGNSQLVFTNSFRSTDGGLTWHPLPLTPGDGGQSVTTGPANTVYVGTTFNSGGRLYKSTNGGATFVVREIFTTFSSQHLIRVGVKPATTLYLATVFPSRPTDNRLLRSRDAGNTWIAIGAAGNGPLGQADTIQSLAIDPTNSDIVYTSGYRSTDGGATWTRLDAWPLAASEAIAIDPSSPSTIYVAGQLLVLKSTDGGQSFAPANAGLPAARLTEIVIDRKRPTRLYASTLEGVYRSTNGGSSWESFSEGLTDSSVRDIAIDSTGTFLHAVTPSGVFDYEIVGAPGALSLNAAHPFTVTLVATDQRTGKQGNGLAIAINDIWGYFSIPDLTGNPNNPEVFVKILDGTALNGKFWVFYGGLTDLEYKLTVTEDATGLAVTYTKEAGSACGGFDTASFP